jgi:hypothetical protein
VNAACHRRVPAPVPPVAPTGRSTTLPCGAGTRLTRANTTTNCPPSPVPITGRGTFTPIGRGRSGAAAGWCGPRLRGRAGQTQMAENAQLLA